MKIKIIISAILLSVSTFSYAQEKDVKDMVDKKKNFGDWKEGWLRGGFFSTNFTNVGLSNWAAGGQNNISINFNTNMFLHFKKGKSVWENYLDLAYGVVKNGNDPFQKNEDKFDFLSKYGRRLKGKFNYAALLNLKTQMFPGFDFGTPGSQHISNFMAPAFGLLSAGVDYKPKDYMSVYLSPATGKFTIVREQRFADLGLFGVEKAVNDEFGNPIAGTGKTFRSELGWYIKVMFVKDIFENVNMQSRLDLFTAYKTPELTDINWETTINMKVNKYINASIFTHLIYDDDFDTNPLTENFKDVRIQFKHVIGVGFSYKFGDKM